MRKRWLAAAVAAVALVLLVADSASAQRRVRLGRRNRGYNGGYVYGPGGYGGYGYGGYGYGGYGMQPMYGQGLMPGYVLGPNGITNTISGYFSPGQQLGAGLGLGVDSRSALIEVRVPPNARVSFDGDGTTQTGTDRLFSSPPLSSGQAYHYTVKARWEQNGRQVERTRRVEVRAGQRSQVDFNQEQSED
jgi:uncharacterized protein (TIGR03000 family)